MESVTTINVASAQYNLDFLNNFEQWKIKTENWVESAVGKSAQILLFPEYGAMELTSLLIESDRNDLKSQAKKLLPMIDDFKNVFSELAKKHNVYIIAPSIPFYQNDTLTTNRVFIFAPNGQIEFQDKFFMTRFEEEEWNIQSGEPVIKVFETENVKFSVSTCFDIEFSFPALAASHAGAQIIFAPSCTETVKGACRVHIGARARALENQNYVVISQTVGESKWSPAVDINYGYAGFYATPDVGFPDDGVLKTGQVNEPGWIVQSLRLSHIQRVRTSGAVFNFKKHQDLQKSFPIQTKMIKLT
ncbi:nitrilase [Bdellovibrio sp. qaytius]|nr:nitrilase [Bdellovibrio sp. qaytius]